MYILSANHRSTTYSSPTIAATALAYMTNGESFLQRFIDILERMEDGEMFVGANFVVQCFKKENEDESC